MSVTGAREAHLQLEIRLSPTNPPDRTYLDLKTKREYPVAGKSARSGYWAVSSTQPSIARQEEANTVTRTLERVTDNLNSVEIQSMVGSTFKIPNRLITGRSIYRAVICRPFPSHELHPVHRTRGGTIRAVSQSSEPVLDVIGSAS